MNEHQKYAEHLKQTDPELYYQLFGHDDQKSAPGCLGLSILLGLVVLLILAVIFN